MEDIKVFLIWFIGRYIVYSMIGAVVSKQWRHIFLWPFFILYDINWRVSVVHGLIKAIKHPVLDVVTWISPTRHIALAEDEVAA